MPFTNIEEYRFREVAEQLPQLHMDPEYEPKLRSLLPIEQADRFEAWQSEQREKRYKALFDHCNAPGTTELVDAIKSIDFAIDATFENFQDIAFRASNTPRIPLFTTLSKKYNVQLGSGISSPRPSQPVEPSTSETVSLPDATCHKYVQAFARDSTQTAPEISRRSLIEYGFTIGTIMAEDRQGKSAEIKNTGFVLVLSAKDKSLWMVYNYYPFNDEGDPVQFEPLAYSRLFQGEIPEGLWFDCSRLYDSVSEWDPEERSIATFDIYGFSRLLDLRMPPSGIPENRRLLSSLRLQTSDIQQLIAAPANSRHFKDFLSTLSVSQSASAPYT